MVAVAEIERAAQELVARYGVQADQFAARWAQELGRSGRIPEESQALMVLSAVERLLDTRRAC